MSFLRLMSLFFSWGLSSLILVTWIQAALHPSHQIIIGVNTYNELWWEAIILPLAWVLVTWNLIYTLKWMKTRNRYQEDEDTSRRN